MIIRVSRGRFDPARSERIAYLLAESEASLRPALQRMAGLRDYYVGLDASAGVMVNISVWDTLEHAQAMSTLTEMLAQRDLFLGSGIQFDPILNHQILWSIGTRDQGAV